MLLCAQLYTEAGLPASAFTGVPVFQAQGLTVKAETQRYTPLFLAKADLDAAVGAAYGQREASREAAAAVKAQAAEEEVAAAQSAVSHFFAATAEHCMHAGSVCRSEEPLRRSQHSTPQSIACVQEGCHAEER